MFSNKKSQELLMLAKTGKPLNKGAIQGEKKFYEEFKYDYEIMHATVKKNGIKN